jgi:hypothetical protein
LWVTRIFEFSYGDWDLAMAAADDDALALEMFGPVDDDPRAFTPIPLVSGKWMVPFSPFYIFKLINT